MKRFITLIVFLTLPLVAQDTILLMSYNLLNYPGTTSAVRNNYYKTIMNAVKPDVLVVQEITSQIGVDGFLFNVMKTVSPNYNKGAFLDGPDSDNAIYYDSTKFDYLSNTPIRTALRDINLFQIRHRVTLDTLFIFSVHLKASTGSDNEIARGKEVDSLRKVTNSWPAGRNFVVLGDFNIYGSTEVAYQKLRANAAGTEGHFIDPIVMSGSFGQSQYAIHHTQSPRTRSFGGGSTGGMDDRFDMILFSQAISDTGGIEYVRNSNTAYGNDGQHYNDSINRPSNTAVGQVIADALHYASDHIPVYQKYIFKQTPTGIKETELPTSFVVENAYPNPFNPATTITWNLPSTGMLNLYIYNTLGQIVSSELMGISPVGKGSYIWEASGFSSGVYFARIEFISENGNFSKVIKLNLMK